MGYIYCIRNKVSGKCYIGETAKEDVSTRWKQHLNLISRGKGCPALKDAVQKHGLENFEFSVVVICFDEARFDLERHYIAKYNSMVPNGYNILPGGQKGKSFIGFKHKPETIEKLRNISLSYIANNPDWFELRRQKWELGMSKVDIGAAVKSSPVWQKAKAEGRIGSAGRKEGKQSEETKQKIRESVIKYYNTNDRAVHNIEKHCKSMAKAVGTKVAQYTISNELVATYDSIAEASRQTNISKSTIGNYIRNGPTERNKFVWKRLESA